MADEQENLTILRTWQSNDNLNGGFEALRRDWLAKVRALREEKQKELMREEERQKINAPDENIMIASNDR